MRPRQSSLGIINPPVGLWKESALETPCFNEAEAIKPRKLARSSLKERPIEHAKDASMRPRQSSLGNIEGPDLYRRAGPGTCFNEAEAIKPRNHHQRS